MARKQGMVDTKVGTKVDTMLVAVGVLAIGLAACGRSTATATATASALTPMVMSDFTLQDINPGSASYGARISPRQYTTTASAWYFGHAT